MIDQVEVDHLLNLILLHHLSIQRYFLMIPVQRRHPIQRKEISASKALHTTSLIITILTLSLKTAVTIRQDNLSPTPIIISFERVDISSII